jgi:hypothetical protein
MNKLVDSILNEVSFPLSKRTHEEASLEGEVVPLNVDVRFHTTSCQDKAGRNRSTTEIVGGRMQMLDKQTQEA